MDKSTLRVTLIGGPTLLLEMGGLRFLTDPTFDPAGGDYDIGLTVLHKTGTPAQAPDTLGTIDAVLLSHDHHADNLDISGRAFLPSARAVLTTLSGADRLRLPNTVGLAPWESREITGSDADGAPFPVRITATPARHGPEGIEPLIGDVIGFVLEWWGKTLYFSGDTVWYEGVAEVGRRFPRLSAAVLFLGGVRRAEGEPLLTMDGAEAVQVVRALGPHIVVPVHYEGWQHFREGRAEAEATFAAAGVSNRVLWLRPGEPQMISI